MSSDAIAVSALAVPTAQAVTIGVPCQDTRQSMSKRDLKALGVSGVDTSRRLELRSGTTARQEKMEENGELVGRVQELQQKLEMAEQAVNAKDQEIEAKCAEFDESKRQAALELQEARKISEELKGALERERENAGRWSEDAEQWKTQAQNLEEQFSQLQERHVAELQDREKELELERLRQVEALRQQFDRERERHRKEVEKTAALVAALQEEIRILKEKSESPSERESDSGLSATVGAGVLAKTGMVGKEKHVTFREPGAELEPGKGPQWHQWSRYLSPVMAVLIVVE